MTTVLDVWDLVDLELETDPFLGDDDDDRPAPPVHTDRAWFLEEAAWLETRSAHDTLRGLDPTGHLRTASAELRGIAAAMAWHRHDDVAPYLADPLTVPGPAPLIVHLPRPGSRRSPLAAALDTLAAWYAGLDTAAGDLVAYHLLWHADGAEWYEAETAQDYWDAEAAYHAACQAEYEAALAATACDPSEL